MSIELKDLSYAYQTNSQQSIPALKKINLKINDGEFVGIMGHTGCGKTTLIQLIAGLIPPTQGRVLLDGFDIYSKKYDKSQLRKKVGIVFQYPEYQLFETTVERDVAFGLKHSGLNKSQVEDRVKWALEVMEFSYEKMRLLSPLSLSGGEKRRVAIAGVLVTRPKILIFDEPIAGLDPLNRKSFLKLMTHLQKNGTTVIIVSHNADALSESAQRLLIMNEGMLLMDDSLKEIFSNYMHLSELGLSSSTPHLLADMLSKRGFILPGNTVTYEDLLKGIKKNLSGGDAL